MNERIRQLAEQAGFRSDVTVTDGNNKRMDTKTSIALEKFAELIVREVFAKIEDERFEVYQPVKESVMKHFGVE